MSTFRVRLAPFRPSQSRISEIQDSRRCKVVRHGLVVVDLNKGGLFFPAKEAIAREERQAPGRGRERFEYYASQRDSRLFPNVNDVLKLFRQAGNPIIFVSFSSTAEDRSDLEPALLRSLQTRNEWWAIPDFDSDGGRMPSQVDFLKDDILINKTGWNAWGNSTLDEQVEKLGLTDLWFCGALTQACVRETALGAIAGGYSVWCIGDCCLSFSKIDECLGLRSVPYKAVYSVAGLAQTPPAGFAPEP